MPTRFGHDARSIQLSSLVVIEQMIRDEAIEILLEIPQVSEADSKELFAEDYSEVGISEE